MIYLYKNNGVITVGEDGKAPITYYGRGGKSGKFYPSGTVLGYAKSVLPTTTAFPSVPAGTYVLYPSILNGLGRKVIDKTFPYSNTPDSYYEVYANTTTGIGNGISFSFSVNQQGVYNLAVRNPGVDYQVGDLVTIDAVDFDGSEDLVMEISSIYSYDTTGSGIRFSIFAIGGTGFVPYINNAGKGYSVGDILTFNGEDIGGAIGTTFAFEITGIEYDGFLINIGGDNYQTFWQEISIDGDVPTSFSNANNLLLNLFS